ncbi:MAG: AMIN domain-containing protein, partial [Candidatus Binatia bacterium]
MGRVLKPFGRIAGLMTGLLLLTSCFFGGGRSSDKVPVERVSVPRVEGVETSGPPAGLEVSSPKFLLGSGTATFQSKPLRKEQVQVQNRRALAKQRADFRQTKVESPKVVGGKIETPVAKASVQQPKPPSPQAVALHPPKLAPPTVQPEVQQVTIAEVIPPELPKVAVVPLVTADPGSLVKPLARDLPEVPQDAVISPSAQAKVPKVPLGRIKPEFFAQPSTPQTPNSLGGRASIALSTGTTGPIRLVGMGLQDVGPTVATVVIESDKPILNYKSFALPDPPRLVVDISEAVHALPMRVKRVAKGPIRNIRTSQFSTTPDWVTRVVIDLSTSLPYRIHAVPSPMRIIVGEPAPPPPAIIPVAAVSPGAGVPPPVSREDLAPPPEIPFPAKRETLPGLAKRISVDLRQIDILAVMKFLAEEGELNIVTGKNVGGRVSLSLKDVSIRDVLDIISLSYELSYVVQNGIIHVMTEADYQRLFGSSFADQRQVRRLQLQHAVPTSVAALLGNLKSTVGRVIADVQTRTIVLIDVPEKLEPMIEAAKSMDRATELQTQVF